MNNFLIQWLGYILPFTAVQWKRNEDSEIKLFSVDWFVVIILISIGTVIITKNPS